MVEESKGEGFTLPTQPSQSVARWVVEMGHFTSNHWNVATSIIDSENKVLKMVLL